MSIDRWMDIFFSSDNSSPGKEESNYWAMARINNAHTHTLEYYSIIKWMCACLVSQQCPTLCDPMDCSLQGSSAYEILQAGILEWVAMPSSRGSSQLRNWTQVSCIAGRFFTVWATRPAHKKNIAAPIAATWMGLGFVILSEVRKRETNTMFHLYMKSKISYKWTYLQDRNRLTGLENKFIVAKGERGDKFGVWD